MYSNPQKTEVRRALAERTGLTLKKVRYDKEALTGDYKGRDLTLYNFNKGRGGIFFAVRLGLKKDSGIEMLVRSGLSGGLSGHIVDRTGRQSDNDFTHHFFVKGAPEETVTRVLDSADLQRGLRAAFDRTGGVEVRVEKGCLIFEQLDLGRHDADYLMSVIGLLGDLAVALEADGE
jgi:hypothetical protein